MSFATQKKELINLRNTLKKNDNEQWIIDFSVVKLMSVWERIIRHFSDEDFSKIDNNSALKIKLDREKLNYYVWKTWLDGKQNNLFQLEVQEAKRYQKIRNKVAHGSILTESESNLISNIGNKDSGFLDKTLNTLEKL